MLRILAIGLFVFAVLGGALQILLSAPLHAQASCMHCRFEAAQCKRIGTLTPDKCEAQRLTCVQKCKAMSGDASTSPDKSKSENKSQKNKKN